jgi:regulator of protease activity HflC (stomatin/prohibitin superfamily)
MQAQINPQLRKNIMLNRVKNIVHSIRNLLALSARKVFAAVPIISIEPQQCAFFGKTLITVGLLGALGYGIYQHPPFQSVPQGSVGVRINQFTGSVSEWRNGNVLVIPGLYQMQVYSLRDQIYRPREIQSATGNAPLQSSEGLSFGVDLSIRYALDPLKITELAKTSPDDISKGLVESAVQGAIYKVFANYTMREIFSVKRVEIQQLIEKEVGASLAGDGIVLRHVQIGNIDLPAEYRRGMESLLAEELATQKMRYTLELKEKQVKQSALEAEAEKARRETEAQAAASEQVIAAKAQEEAMKHVLPFKEKQIQQRQLEAEADKVARIRGAEGSAQARRIEAAGEADARQKLADAEVYRAEHMGKTNAEQMEREGALVTKYPLLIQKTLADKLSDKVQVIIASPPSGGGFIGANLLGSSAASTARPNETAGAE